MYIYNQTAAAAEAVPDKIGITEVLMLTVQHDASSRSMEVGKTKGKPSVTKYFCNSAWHHDEVMRLARLECIIGR